MTVTLSLYLSKYNQYQLASQVENLASGEPCKARERIDAAKPCQMKLSKMTYIWQIHTLLKKNNQIFGQFEETKMAISRPSLILIFQICLNEGQWGKEDMCNVWERNVKRFMRYQPGQTEARTGGRTSFHYPPWTRSVRDSNIKIINMLHKCTLCI